MPCLKIIVRGEIQDVGFRYSIKAKALELGITGYVKNISDGSVEIVAQGEETKLNELISWAKTGPRFSRVDKVEISWSKPEEQFLDFEIRY